MIMSALVFQILATTLASDSAITIARFRPFKLGSYRAEQVAGIEADLVGQSRVPKP